MDENETILEATLALKRSIIALLEKTVAELKESKTERLEWLAKPSITQPTFKRRYTKQVVIGIENLEEREYKKGKSKTLTKATKQHITALNREQKIVIEEKLTEMQSDYEFDLANDPNYIGLDDTQLAEVAAEFEERRKKAIKRIKADYEARRTRVIERQPVYRQRQRQQTVRQIPALTEIRHKYLKLQQELAAVQQVEKEEELAAFEEDIETYLSYGRTEEDIAIARKEVLDQLEKQQRLKMNSLIAASNRAGRMATADVIAAERESSPNNNDDGLVELLSIYAAAVSKARMRRFGDHTWESYTLLVDRAFEDIREWKEFISYAVAGWSNLGDSSTRRELDTMIRKYALLYIDEGSNGDTGVSLEDERINKLSAERTKLLKEILDADQRITRHIADQKAEVERYKRHALRNRRHQQQSDTVVTAPIAPPPSTIYDVRSDYDARRAALEAMLAEEDDEPKPLLKLKKK